MHNKRCSKEAIALQCTSLINSLLKYRPMQAAPGNTPRIEVL